VWVGVGFGRLQISSVGLIMAVWDGRGAVWDGRGAVWDGRGGVGW
jgi:hypothetical protein